MIEAADWLGWSDEEEREAWIRDKCACVYCGLDGRQSLANWCALVTDHLLPRSHFTSNPEDATKQGDRHNLVVACSSCNALKANANPATDPLPAVLDADWHEATLAIATRIVRSRKNARPDPRPRWREMMMAEISRRMADGRLPPDKAPAGPT